MKPMSVTVPAGAGNRVLMLDVYGWPNVSIQVVTTGGTYTVEQTLSDPNAPGAVWFPHPDAALVGATTNKQGNYAFLPFAMRLNQASGGPTTMTVLQVGPSPA